MIFIVALLTRPAHATFKGGGKVGHVGTSETRQGVCTVTWLSHDVTVVTANEIGNIVDPALNRDVVVIGSDMLSHFVRCPCILEVWAENDTEDDDVE